jgi:hypothetical protein
VLGWWTYGYYLPSKSFLEYSVRPLMAALEAGPTVVGGAFSASEFFLNRVGFLLVIAYIALGALLVMSKKIVDSVGLSLVGATGMLALITYGLPSLGIQNLIPGRWIVFIMIMSAPVAAEAFVALPRLAKSALRQGLIVVLSASILSFFMVNNVGVNAHSPLYGGANAQDPPRYAFSQSELTAAQAILGSWDGKIITDYPYYYLPLMTEVGPQRLEVINAETGDGEGMVVLRDYIRTHWTQEELVLGNPGTVEGYLNGLDTSGYDVVYSNKSVKAYLPNP